MADLLHAVAENFHEACGQSLDNRCAPSLLTTWGKFVIIKRCDVLWIFWMTTTRQQVYGRASCCVSYTISLEYDKSKNTFTTKQKSLKEFVLKF